MTALMWFSAGWIASATYVVVVEVRWRALSRFLGRDSGPKADE